ncbi:MAG TPA: UDP-glucose 4-epimerase GalE [Sporichthyaceae bacterium]|nr:UDP-glucose 4-epimerase GalE [Sporichthyaceae bacterium]
MTWLVTGGAGYIGAHVVLALRDAGHRVVVLDDLSTGVRDRVPADVPFLQADVADADAVRSLLAEHEVAGVVHVAAKKSVPESVAHPLSYYRENVGGFGALLSAMSTANVRRLVLSSSASVLGTPVTEPVDEEAPTRPENPYGRSKLICEWMLADAAAAEAWQWISLRYFNVAGAGAPDLGDRGGTNLIPAVLAALSAGERARVFGGDWPTRDGTCVRDYIHVVDLARAHVAAVDRLTGPDRYGRVFNVGRGEGVTVREVLDTVAEVTGTQVGWDIVERRPGDPASVVGAVHRIAAELGWRAELDLREMIADAWEAWQHRP